MKLFEQSFIKLKKKKRICNIAWSYEKHNVIQYASCLQHGEIDLATGNYTKISYPSNLTNNIISLTLVSTDNTGTTIVGVLSSCDISILNVKSKSLKIIKGPKELLAHLSQFSTLKSYDPLQHLQNFAKQHRFLKSSKKDNESSNTSNDDCKKSASSLLFKPQVYSSKDLSKVLLIADYSKVFLWTEQTESAEASIDPWNSYEPSSGIEMPPKNTKDACIDVAFISNGPTGLSCCVAYCFASENHLIITSLILQWHESIWANKVPVSAKWISKKVEFKKISSEINFVKKKKALVMKFSVDEHNLCLAVNTLKNYFYLVFYHLDSESIGVVECAYPKKDQESVNRYQWVSCLTWCTGNNLIIGCLRSGHVFIATRSGQLIKINWNNTDHLVPGVSYVNMFPEFNISNKFYTENDISEISSRTSSSMTPKYSILSDFSRNRIVVSSGLNFSWFELPNDMCSNEGILSYLLKRTHHANHKLESLLMNHEYDFIHCSNWRLASKSHHHKGPSKKICKEEEGTICSLWFPGNVPFINSSVDPLVQTDLETVKTEVFELLQATWSLLALRNFKKRERKQLTKASVSEALKLFNSVMKTSSGNDNEEHQASLIQCLRFFHFLVEYIIAVTPYKYKVIRPCLQVLYNLLNLVMKSVRQASSERKLICVVILTQTLTSLKSSLMKGSFLSSFKTLDEHDLEFGKLLDSLMRKQWIFLYRNLLSLWREERIRKHSQLNCMLIVVLNVIQERIYTSIASRRKMKITNEFKLFSSGKYLVAVENMKSEIEKLIHCSFCRKRIKKCVFFAFHVLVVEIRYHELINFVSWFFKIVSTPQNGTICSKKCSSSLKRIFVKLCGVLGVLMAKFILGIPVHILHSFECYDYTSLLDNPKKNYKILNSEKYFEKNLFTSLNAIRCLIIGGKYEVIFDLAAKEHDLNLCIFSLFTLDKDLSNNVQTLEDFVINEIFTHLKSESEISSDDELTQRKMYFITEQLFHLGVLEELENVLPECLRRCLMEIMNLVKDLPLIVPFNFHLPSPPLFCPQMDSGNYSEVDLDNDESKGEFVTRQKLSCWINHFCLLCSSSGLDGIFVKYTKDEGLDSNYKQKEMSNLSTSLLDEKETMWMKKDNQWSELQCIWLSFLEIMCAFHTRDNVSILLRTLIEAKANMLKYKNIQLLSFQIMNELSKISNSPWKDEAFSLIVTSAFDASYTVEMVYLLAVTVAHQQEQMPSLLKDKLDKVFELWKNIKINPNNDDYSEHRWNLFELYQKNLKLQEVKTKNLHQSFSFPLSKEYTDMICLLIRTTFLKLKTEFSEFEQPFPFICQFRNQIKDVELQGMKPTDIFSTFLKIQTSKIFKDSKNTEDTLFKIPVSEKLREGLFRNHRGKRCSERSPDTAQIIYNNSNNSHSKSKWRTKSFSHRKTQTPKNSKIKRSKSLGKLRQEKQIYKTVSSLKCDVTGISSTPKLFNEFISDIYYSFLFTSYNSTKLTSRFLNFVLWILRYDRMSFTSRDLRSIKFQSIFTINDLKQAIFWYSADDSKTRIKSSIRNISKLNKSKCNIKSGNLIKKNVRQSTENDVKTCLTKFSTTTNNNNNNNSDNSHSSTKNENPEKYDHFKDADKNDHVKDVKLSNEASKNSCEDALIDSSSENSKYNVVPCEEDIKINEKVSSDKVKLNINADQWQPFVVKETPCAAISVTDSKPEIANCRVENEEKHSNSTCISSGEDLPKSISCSGMKLENGFSFTSEETETSSSHRYDFTINDANDNTLDDITLSNVLSESDGKLNSSEKCSPNQKNKHSKTFFESNNLTFLKNPLLQDNKTADNSDIRILNSHIILHQPVKKNAEMVQPSPLNLSQFFSKPLKLVSNPEAGWTLRKIPLNLLKKDISHSDVNMPSKLLKIPYEQEPQHSQPILKEPQHSQPILKEIRLSTLAAQRKTNSELHSFRLLKISKELNFNNFGSNKNKDINLIDKKHFTSINNDHNFKKSPTKSSEKFTQTRIESNQKSHDLDDINKTPLAKDDYISFEVKFDGYDGKISSDKKIKDKLVNSKKSQICFENSDVKVSEKCTQTNPSTDSLAPKRSVEEFDINFKDSGKDHTVRVKLVENKEMQTNLKGINLKSQEISTQTKKILEISSETQTPIQHKRIGTDKATLTSFSKFADKATSTILKNSSRSTQVTPIENSDNDFKKSRDESLAVNSNSVDEHCLDLKNFKEESIQEESQKNHCNEETFPEHIIEENAVNRYDIENESEFGIRNPDDIYPENNEINVNLSLFNASVDIYSESNNTQKNVGTENSEAECQEIQYEDDFSELKDDDDDLLNITTRSKPKTFEDVISLFMSGELQVDEVCSLVPNFPEYIGMMETYSKKRTESPRKLLSHAVKNVNKVKQEISWTKSLLEKVDMISNKCFQEDVNLTKYFGKILEHRKSTKKALPNKPNPEQILEFLQQISPKDLKQDEISRIMELVESETQRDDCQINLPLKNKLLVPNSFSPTLSQGEKLHSDIAGNSRFKGTMESKYFYNEFSDYNEEIHFHQQSPDLNLNLPKFGLGAFSPIMTVTSSDSVTAKEQRRKEIRAFMQRKRLERRENSSSLVFTGNKGSLTNREIMERNRSMETRRERLKEEHVRKRREEIQFIFEDHNRDKESIEPILKPKITSASLNHSLFLNKKLKTEEESYTNRYSNYSNETFEDSITRKKSKKLNFSPCNPLLKRELTIFSNYLASSQPLHRNLKFNKRELLSTSKPVRVTAQKSSVKETFTRSLERISEIDSSSISSTLTDSSWSLPDDIKKIVNSNNENL